MKSFLFKICLFITLVITILLWAFFRADGGFDPYYLRFTSPPQSSMILGTSRAAHGLQPGVLNKLLHRNDLYNYAFSMTHSPYGPTYLESIKRKLKPGSNALFILSVDPWSLSSKWNRQDDLTAFEEKSLALGILRNVNQKPNLQYLLQCPGNPYLMIFKKSNTMFLHDDGWLEVNISMDTVSKQQRLKEKIKYYEEFYLPKYKFSTLRLKYLDSTITYLKKYGKVYLVRLPVHPSILKFDQQVCPDFNLNMNVLSLSQDVPYLDLSQSGSGFEYIDGNHLYKSSGEKISALIAEWINKAASTKH